MRIDLSSKLAHAAENDKPVRRAPPSAAHAAPARPEPGSDQARLSLDHPRLRTLEAGVNGLPEVRQNRVDALQRVIARGTYDVPPEKIADAVVSEMLAGSSRIG